jgi:RHS repeat-associated protein
VSTEYSTNSGASWASAGGTSQVSVSLSSPGVASTVQVFTPTLNFSGGGPVWIRLILRGTASGTISGGLVRVRIYANTGWTTDPYPVMWSNYSGSMPLVAVKGGPTRVDYLYHDGSQGLPGTLKEVYAGSTLAPGAVPTGGAVIGWHYPNGYGRDTLVIDGGGHTRRWTYAAAGSGGNLVQTTDALGHVTAFHYNAYGLVDTTTKANGVKQSAAYDAINRDTAMTNGLHYTTRYSYGPLGLTRVKDPKGQVYKFDRNAWGLLVAQHDLADTTKADTLKYDVGAEPRMLITRRSDTIRLTYDALGRVRTRTGPDFPAESLSYGILPAGGSWTVASSTNGRDSLAYDKAGRLVYAAQHVPGDTTTYAMSYTYDSTGHLINRAAPTHGSPARWVYHPNLGVLDTMCAVGTCAAVARDTELKPVTVTYNSAAAPPWWSHTVVYDSLHHVTSDWFTATTSLTSAWTYDSVGRVAHQSGQSGGYPMELYTYDAAGELINACQMQSGTSACNNEYNQAAVPAYVYDSAGNRIDTTAHAVVGAGNRVTQFRAYQITYDLNGDVLMKAGLGTVGIWTSTDTTRFQWNAARQLTGVEKWPAGGAHTVVTFRYNALGRRIAKTGSGVTTWFIYDRDQVAMDLDSATHAIRAEYGFTETGTLYALRSPTDTVVAVTTPTIGTVLGIARATGGTILKVLTDQVGNSPLLPWGQEPADTGFIIRYRMGQQEYDQETALYHMGARYYDPMLGRWLSEDPAGTAGGPNLYAYAGNDPVNGRDPSGLGAFTNDCPWTQATLTITCQASGADCAITAAVTECNQLDQARFCADWGGDFSSGICRMGPANPGGGAPTGQSPSTPQPPPPPPRRVGPSCPEFTAPAPVGKWGDWVVAASGWMSTAPTKWVISADAVTLPVPPEGMDTPINGQVRYCGAHGWTVDNFVGGQQYRFTTAPSAGADITAHFQSAGPNPIWVTGHVCP